MKQIFLVLNENNHVIDIVESVTEHFYCDVEDGVTVDEIKESLQIGSQVLRWEDECLVAVDEYIADHDSFVPPDQLVEWTKLFKQMDERIKSLETAIHNLTGGVEHEVEIEI